ncbi:MAG: hypothetical protein Q7T82_20130 [Armatimonadota bacterium]|nr:hypothetical protein [Armatimonadota bacterium]
MALSNAMGTLTESFLGAYADRVAQVASICSDTAQTLSEFHGDHQRMAAELRQRLTDQHEHLLSDVSKMRADRVAQVASICSDTAQTLSEFHGDHQRMAAELRQRLLSDVNKMRADVQTDHRKARKIWTDFSAEMQQRRAGKSGAPSKKTASARGMTDDLTVIAGIGATRQQRLNEMGIHTFAQLASSSSQKMSKAFGAFARAEQWTKEARKLSSK